MLQWVEDYNKLLYNTMDSKQITPINYEGAKVDPENPPVNPDPSSPPEGEEGTGSTFGNDDSPIYLDDSNNNINP